MVEYDYLIVGCGLYGAAFARCAKERGYKVLIIDKRSHIGGTAFDNLCEGIMVHNYGPHIFHTNDNKVWDFVNRFSEFNNYVNTPLAYCGTDNTLYPLPFNMYTFNKMWSDVKTPLKAKEKIEEEIKRANITNPQNLEEEAVSLVGWDIYNKLIKGYTEKQWGCDCKDLPTGIITRLPLRFTYNNNYFNDKYQGIPIHGYTSMVENMIDGIEVKLDTNYLLNKEYFYSITKNVVYTGRLDELYNYRFGILKYRGCKWETTLHNTTNFQGTCVINYTTHEVPYTRAIEHKYFTCLREKEVNEIPITIVSREYPLLESEVKSDNSFYPINNRENNDIYQQYAELSKQDKKYILGGRLADYKYYNMDQVIKNVLNYWE